VFLSLTGHSAEEGFGADDDDEQPSERAAATAGRAS